MDWTSCHSVLKYCTLSLVWRQISGRRREEQTRGKLSTCLPSFNSTKCRNPRTVLHEGDPGTLHGKDNLLQQTCLRLGHKETRRRGLFLEIQTCAVAEMLQHQTFVIPFVRSFCLQMVKKKTKRRFFLKIYLTKSVRHPASTWWIGWVAIRSWNTALFPWCEGKSVGEDERNSNGENCGHVCYLSAPRSMSSWNTALFPWCEGKSVGEDERNSNGENCGHVCYLSAPRSMSESKNSVTWRRSWYIVWERQPTATNLRTTGPQRNQKKGIVSWNSNLCCCWDVATSNLRDSICEKLLPPDGEKENKTEFFFLIYLTKSVRSPVSSWWIGRVAILSWNTALFPWCEGKSVGEDKRNSNGENCGHVCYLSAPRSMTESKNSVTWRRSWYIVWERQPTATNLRTTGPQRNQKKGIVSWNSNLCCCWDVATSNLRDSICEKLLPPDGEKENKTEFFLKIYLTKSVRSPVSSWWIGRVAILSWNTALFPWCEGKSVGEDERNSNGENCRHVCYLSTPRSMPESKNSVTWRRSWYIVWERQPTATNLRTTGPERKPEEGDCFLKFKLVLLLRCCDIKPSWFHLWEASASRYWKRKQNGVFFKIYLTKSVRRPVSTWWIGRVTILPCTLSLVWWQISGRRREEQQRGKLSTCLPSFNSRKYAGIQEQC